MVKRLLKVGLFTGFGHLLVFLSLSYASGIIDAQAMAKFGTVDAMMLFILSAITFGLQLATTRNIATTISWKEDYESTIKAQVTFGLIVAAFGLLLYAVKGGLWWTLTLAPVIGLSGDFALYGSGRAVTGSFFAFVRVLVPSLLLFSSAFLPQEHLVHFYFSGIVLSYAITGLYTAKIFERRYWVVPGLQSLLKYWNNRYIGLSSMGLLFLGIGIINVAPTFYGDQAVSDAYIALKYYMIYKGLRRIIVQSFLSEISKKPSTRLYIDRITILGGALFFTATFLYPDSLLPYIIDGQFSGAIESIAILGFSALIIGTSSSLGFTLLTFKKDRLYSIILIIAGLAVVVLVVLFSLIEDSGRAIVGAVLIGELAYVVLLFWALRKNESYFPRIKFASLLLVPMLAIKSLEYFDVPWYVLLITTLAYLGYHSKTLLNFEK